MLNNKKRVFWEALILTILIFLLGFLSGLIFENKRVEVIEKYYIQSENSLMDIFALNNFVSLNNISCDALISSNINFADRIYDEAKILDEYEKTGKITDKMDIQHKKYDIMRTFLWINTIKTAEICKNNSVHTIVYIYQFNTNDLTEKATNSVWSKILADLKETRGNDIILIPIAADSDIIALNSMLENYDVQKYPVLIIDNKYLIKELSSVEEIEKYLS
ncbi:MAG: hypothetical protein Q8O84_00115 [Nanoarchaeota archaeon]|nr:hypothetical protein [Nanoarchaeota archaeon]